MSKQLIAEIEARIKEIEVTKDNNEHWNGVKTGLGKAINIIKNYKPSRTRITDKQIEAEAFVDSYTTLKGHPPSYWEVAKELGLKSTNTAYHRLRHCREKMITQNR